MKFPTLTMIACALAMVSMSWRPVQAAEPLTGSDRAFVAELVATQQDYLIALSAQGYFTRDQRAGSSIIGQLSLETATARLRSLGMADQEIAELERTGVPTGMAPFHAEAGGTIEAGWAKALSPRAENTRRDEIIVGRHPEAKAISDVQPARMGPHSSRSIDLVLQSRHKEILPAVEMALIKAIMAQESSFRIHAVRFEPRLGDASYGLMQILSSTAKDLGYAGQPLGLLDPVTNLAYGVRYLQQLMERYSRIEDVIAAYNAGRPMRNRSGAYVNQRYVNGVLKHLRHYRAESVKAGL